MGFQDWFEALKLILVSLVLIGVPCVVTVIIGSRVINDLGNTPTHWAEIQQLSVWKVLLVQIIALALLIGFFNAIS